jgi:competence protein ComEC
VSGEVAPPGAAAPTSGISVRPVSKVSDLSADPPQVGTYRIHLIDVGTGLSILIQGHDFNLLYDGGSNDDGAGISASGNNSRLLAYLYGALGPSGPSECVPNGDQWPNHAGSERVTIQHVVLSHPHKDHADMLDEVIHCYTVENVWDSGVVNPTKVYAEFLQAVSEEPGVTFHTVLPIPPDRQFQVGAATVAIPNSVAWISFGEGTQQALGQGASFVVLYADTVAHPNDYNRNSLVLRVNLGQHSLLLMGDAESGSRQNPSAPAGGTELALIDQHAQDLHVDILQVGHHGSKTSSRRAFLEKVKPKWALIGSGPFEYSGTVLPDQEVVDALVDTGATVLRTDPNDGHCPTQDRIGRDDDSKPGGCDNFLLDVGP